MATSNSVLLRECHRLRRHLRELQTEIERGPRTLKIQETRLANEEQLHKDAYETIKKLKLKQKDDEGALKTIETQLGKLYTRSMEVTTMKEMDATKSEMDQAGAKKSALEDSILTTIMDIEERTTNLPKVEAQWKQAQADFAQYQVDAKERLERLLKEQSSSKTLLEDADKLLPVEIQPTYLRLVKAHGADALAGVIGRVCQNCRTTLTEQQRNELLSGRFMTCPSCFRGLYLAE
ncbi:MAG: zinc ribbon domain-containing protein [Gemmataceae bacterium]